MRSLNEFPSLEQLLRPAARHGRTATVLIDTTSVPSDMLAEPSLMGMIQRELSGAFTRLVDRKMLGV